MAATKIPTEVDAAFVASTTQRSMPNPNRPRLNTESEAKLAEVDRRDAVKYASIETFTHQFNKLADGIDAEVAQERAQAIPEEAEWEDDSMVHNIEDARAKLSR